MDYLESTARVTSHIPDKGQVTDRYCGLYASAHRGKIKKAIDEITDVYSFAFYKMAAMKIYEKAIAIFYRKYPKADPPHELWDEYNRLVAELLKK